ncbi:MAG: lamin tail domain-containing protein [Myxococcales bacterium]|nr:lamin tail domain-containing protein [Myxococcales bacterium]
MRRNCLCVFMCLGLVSACGGGGTSPDKCQNVKCNTPPGATCDGKQRLTYAPTGTCVDGGCVYDPRPELCAVACRDGECVSDLCAGVSCDVPPKPSCEGDTLVSYAQPGTCDPATGFCSYSASREACPAACQDGACTGCTRDDDCPADPPRCLDGTLLETSTPRCQAGVCSQVTQKTDCAASNRLCQNGACAGSSLRAPRAGEVIVSEFLANPQAVADNLGEWFEVRSLAAVTLEMSGVRVGDEGTSGFTVSPAASLPLAPGGILVLGINGDLATNGGVTVDYDYASFALANGSDSVRLIAPDGTLIDAVRYDTAAGWSISAGRSLRLDEELLDAELNDDPAAWCPVLESYGLGDGGTPGAPGGTCLECQTAADCESVSPQCQDSLHLLQFTARCDAGACRQDVTTVDCSESGRVCQGGACVSPYRPPAAGELVVSEFMADPSKVNDAVGEWFELANLTDERLTLAGLTVHDDGSNRFSVPADSQLTIGPRARLVFAINGDFAQNGGLKPDYVYSSFTLANSADAIVLELPDVGVIDAVRYSVSGGWAIAAGKSLQLRENFLDANANDDPTHWCQTTLSYGAGDLGTPGALNTSCAN